MKRSFVATTAAVALAFTAAPASAQFFPGEGDWDTAEDWSFSVLEFDADINNDHDWQTNVNIRLNKFADVRVDLDYVSLLDLDSAAIATVDNKQLMEDNWLIIEAREGESDSDINNAAGADVSSDGNTGVNIAAGYFNQQDNVAAIAMGDYDGSGPGGGMAEASLLGVQLSRYNQNILNQDEDQEFDEDNTVGLVEVTSDGNTGVNVAAGAFNQQKNGMAMAVATNASLAEANAVVFQSSYYNTARVNDADNDVVAPIVSGSGNIGVNLAAGSHNQQQNALVVAAGTAFAGGGGGGL